MKSIKRFTLLTLLPLSVLVAAPALPRPAHSCELLGILGAPDSCVRACQKGFHSAYDNQTCYFDILIGW